MKQVGATLIEFMIALSIGLFLISLLFNVYIGSVNNVALQANIIEALDAFSNSTQIVVREIERAGYIGCAKLTEDFPIRSYQDVALNFENKLIVNDHYLISKHANFNHANLVSAYNQSKGMLLTDNCHFYPDNILIISDCNHAEIFRVKKSYRKNGIQKIEPTSLLHFEFDKNAEVALFEINKLFVREFKRWGDRKSPMYALYLEDIHHQIKPLQEGMADIQFKSFYDQQHLSAVGFTMLFDSNQLKKEWYGYAPLS